MNTQECEHDWEIIAEHYYPSTVSLPEIHSNLLVDKVCLKCGEIQDEGALKAREDDDRIEREAEEEEICECENHQRRQELAFRFWDKNHNITLAENGNSTLSNFNLTLEFKKGDKAWVGSCKELGIVTNDEHSIGDVVELLTGLVVIHLQRLIDAEELEQFLKEPAQ